MGAGVDVRGTVEVQVDDIGADVDVRGSVEEQVDDMGARVDVRGTVEVQANSRRPNSRTGILLQQWTSIISACFLSSTS